MLSMLDNVNADNMKRVISDVFKQRFSGSTDIHIKEWDVEFPYLDNISSSTLESPFTKEEIFKSLKELDGNKDLGPYKFPLKFVKSFWNVFKISWWLYFKCFIPLRILTLGFLRLPFLLFQK